jgi:hypothetical protein
MLSIFTVSHGFTSRDTLIRMISDSLPLNPNGTKSSTDDLNALSGLAAIMDMTVQNFRARIVVPSQAQFASGSFMQVLAYYFELTSPPTGFTTVSDADFFTWTVPFQNATWTHGQLTFQHQGPLRVKMAWPQYSNRVTFIHFDTTLNVSCFCRMIEFSCRSYRAVRSEERRPRSRFHALGP